MESDAKMAGDEQGEKDAKAGDSKDSASVDSDMFIAAQEDGELLTANLVGAYVNDSEGNSLGSIQNVLLDSDRKVRGLVVGVGGFLGIGAKAVAVDFAKFEETRGEDGTIKLMLSASKKDLQEAPTFKSLAAKRADEKAKAAQQEAKEKMQQQQQQQQSGGGTGTSSGGTAN